MRRASHCAKKLILAEKDKHRNLQYPEQLSEARRWQKSIEWREVWKNLKISWLKTVLKKQRKIFVKTLIAML